MNFDDPYIRFLGRLVLAVLALAFLATCSISLATVIDWYLNDEAGPGNDRLVRLVNLLPKLSGKEVSEVTNIFAILASAVPLALTPVCFKGEGATKNLNAFGKILTLSLLIVCASSVLGYLMIKPSVWGPLHDLGAEGLLHLQDWAKAALRGAVFYLGTLLGIKASK